MVFEFIEKLKVLSHCNEQTGWFTTAGLESLRRFLLEVVDKKVDAFIQKSSLKFEKSPSSIQLSEEVVDQRIDALTKYMKASGREEEEMLKPSVDPSTIWLKKYLQNASHSEVVDEDEVHKSYSSAAIPKSGIYNRNLDASFSSPPAIKTSTTIKPIVSAAAKSTPCSNGQNVGVAVDRIQQTQAFSTLVDSDSEYSD
jgi:hypothetical protein